jgi:type I restriction enzyme, S subunit
MKDNWEFTSLEKLFSFVVGGDWGKDLNEDDPEFIEAFCIRGSEIREWDKNKGNTASLRNIARNSVEKRKLQYGDILLEISGGGPDQPVGRTVFIDDDVLQFEPQTPKVCTNFLRLLRLIEEVDKKFIY